ncbi:hypothetical protein DFJ43DRAFT_1162517 [Lentinula guzmanii]|uniref:Uncharacterized protein n=1 Tax=Lentinula guzmanii TaxID=2804957 RepID=A0AA38J5Q2_9AGAR|nr:hypothetical protein DFJ43DRAFT_1162517 [Lentinula guzmanii]
MTNAKWMDQDKAALVDFVYSRKAELGNGGNLVKQLANGAAADFVQIGPLKKIYEAICDVKDHCYVGASRWPWNDDNGFQVTAENADAWRAFSKAHPVFSPFTNQGWPLYEKMSEMCPKIPKGRHVFSAGSSQLSQSGNISQSILSESQNDKDGLSFGQDEWPESPRHREASPLKEETEASSQSFSQSVAQADKEMIQPTPVKPASAKKQAAEVDDTPATKKARVTGSDALYVISQSMLAVSSALREMLGSHTDKVSLHILFSKNTASADSYQNAEDWI